jgi:pimeloyl-ACP methyl ester carboxylesterase
MCDLASSSGDAERRPRVALEHATFTLNDVSHRYVKAGAGPLLLCIHGFARHWDLFRPVIEEFACDYTVVALELRGFNLTICPARLRDNAPWVCADELAALVQHLGFETCTAVGHDLGAPVCYSMALHWPQRLSRLVVMQAMHPGALARGNDEREVRPLVIAQPTLSIVGDADTDTDTDADTPRDRCPGLWARADTHIPDLELHRLEGAGRCLLEQRSARVNALLRSFLFRTCDAEDPVRAGQGS